TLSFLTRQSGGCRNIAFARHMETSFSIQACKTSRVAGCQETALWRRILRLPLADSRAEMTFPAPHSPHPTCLPPSLLVSAIVARPGISWNEGNRLTDRTQLKLCRATMMNSIHSLGVLAVVLGRGRRTVLIRECKLFNQSCDLSLYRAKCDIWLCHIDVANLPILNSVFPTRKSFTY